ncbi:MAG: hypothetical protein ACFFD4_28065 [Candidatus Odinarchaeota archaeon]
MKGFTIQELKKIQIRRILGSAVMSFFLGLLFYIIAAAILVDTQFPLAAEIRGREINIVEHIIKPFAGNPPSGVNWNIQDYAALIIVWLLAGVIGGFAGKKEFNGAIGSILAFFSAVTISLFGGAPLVGSDPASASFFEIIITRLTSLFVSEELFRIVLFCAVTSISGYYFGNLSKDDAEKIHQFWLQLDKSSNKIQLPFQCPQCQVSFESNPIYCSSCGKKVREEIKVPII